MGFKAKKFIIEKEYKLPIETVWQILSDTDTLNRFIGLFPVKFTDAKKRKKEVFFREALAKVAGIVPLTWEESPFEWSTNEFYTVERRYLSGPLKHFKGGVELIQLENRATTLVRLVGEFTPRNILGLAAIPITGLQSMRNTIVYLDAYMKQKDSTPYLPQKKQSYKVALDKLNRKEKQLRTMPIKQELVDILHEHLVTRSDQEVLNMRPRTMANKWKTDRLETLRFFLYATKSGILSLNWSLICPNCRATKAEYSTLSDVKNVFHCDLCGVSYNAEFENYVELKFSVHPSVRKAYEESYCVGGPMISPHVLIQKIIKAGTGAVITLPFNQEQMQLRVLQANHKAKINTNETVQITPFIYNNDGWEDDTCYGDTSISIKNESDHSIVLVVEKSKWNTEATTAAEVTAFQEFRDLFSAEVLAPGLQVGINNVTILFSDLQGSTSLYEEIGDANAYGQVRRHFDYLTQWISKNNGSVVKTIGDAVMAVFYRSEDGLNAALQIQNNIKKYNDRNDKSIVLKIGLYSGPAIVVNSNNRLDYFGRTVNIAARIQNKSYGGDIVVHHSYLQNETIQSILQGQSANLESFTAVLKGIESKVDLVRITNNID